MEDPDQYDQMLSARLNEHPGLARCVASSDDVGLAVRSRYCRSKSCVPDEKCNQPMTDRPPPLLARENDYEDVMKRTATWSPTASVIIPVYNRVNRLAVTLAGFVAQTTLPEEIVIADDGSEEDVSAVVERYSDLLPLRYVRRGRDGFGAGQARNLGAEATHSDVLIFIDSDCIPAPDLVERHLSWHRRASGLVVVGSRFHLDGDSVSPEMVQRDFSSIRSAAIRISDDGTPDDWRGLFYRRNRKLRIGDGSYRAVVSSNLSVDARRFHDLGGFPDGFHTWGGEDTELGWRLWNDGAFVVAANDAVVFHQLEPGEDRSWRTASINANRMLMADRIPHRFYRKVPSPFHSVPRVTWIVSVASPDAADAAWNELSRSTYPDAEVIFTGSSSALERVSVVSDNPRVQWVQGDDVGEAIRLARGELVVMLDGRMTPNRRLLERVVRRFDVDPRIGIVRGAYAIKGAGTYRRFGDLLAFDLANGAGRPLFAAIRRREVMKEVHAGGTPDWERLLRRCRLDLLINDTVTGHAGEFELPERSVLPLGSAEIVRAGAEETVRTLKRVVQARRSGRHSDVTASPQAQVRRPVIRYVGWTGKQNLGDEAMLAATRESMPWAEIDPSADSPSGLMLGGGTLINSNGDYLRRIERLDSPRVDRVIFGTGVRSPDYWGESEPVERWWPIFESSLKVTVRGPDSERHLRRFGYEGTIEVIGDPALSLQRPKDVERVDGRVVVCPLDTGGECWGGDDREVLDHFSDTIDRLQAEGRDVVIMTAFPGDDRCAIDLIRRSGHPYLGYVPGYVDLDATLRLLASADLVIGERLHAVVLAATMETPFVAVEYRPKVLDFARSIDQEDAVVRTDDMGRLDEVIDRVLAERGDIVRSIRASVEPLRVRQRGVADVLREAFDG